MSENETLSRLFSTSRGIFADFMQPRLDILNKICGSPIEIMLGCAILFTDRLLPTPGHSLFLCVASEPSAWPPACRLLVPQYKILQYRADWAIVDGEVVTLIECDGHDFHEKTKEQAAHDKQRDRELQGQGHPVLRYTGSEIHRDPVWCAREVIEFVNNRRPKELSFQSPRSPAEIIQQRTRLYRMSAARPRDRQPKSARA